MADHSESSEVLKVPGTDAHTQPSEMTDQRHETPIDEANQPATPEFVAQLVEQIDGVAKERSQLFAKRYGQTVPSVTDEPGVLKIRAFRQQDSVLRKQEDELRARLNKVLMLIQSGDDAPASPTLEEA